jgi:hypothetical protein
MVIAIYYFTQQISKNDEMNPTLVPHAIKMGELGEYDAPLPLEGEGKLYIGEGVSLSYSLWVYVSDWSSGQTTNTIFKRSLLKESGSMSSLKIDYGTNELIVDTHVNTLSDVNCATNNFRVSGFPLQKWNHIAYVLNGTFIDVYLNGKLKKSVLFKDTSGVVSPKSCVHGDNDADSIFINNADQYSGHMSKFRYFSRAILPTDVIDLYNSGPL